MHPWCEEGRQCWVPVGGLRMQYPGGKRVGGQCESAGEGAIIASCKQAGGAEGRGLFDPVERERGRRGREGGPGRGGRAQNMQTGPSPCRGMKSFRRAQSAPEGGQGRGVGRGGSRRKSKRGPKGGTSAHTRACVWQGALSVIRKGAGSEEAEGLRGGGTSTRTEKKADQICVAELSAMAISPVV